MKKTLSALIILLSTSSAFAEPIPDGCYVAFNDPNYCYESFTGLYEWIDYSEQSNVAKYGSPMAAIIKSWSKEKSDSTYWYNNYLSEFNARNSCANNYNSLLASNNSLVTDYNNLVTPYNKNLALIKKLRKACGAKCKKIK